MTITSLIQDGSLLAVELIKGASKVIYDLYNYNNFGKFLVLFTFFYIIRQIAFYIFINVWYSGVEFYYNHTGKESEFIDD